jgi:hypothetical protein
MVLEPGLLSSGLVTNPWSAPRWRADIAGIVRRRLLVIEVKGTKADARREKYDSGKWAHPLPLAEKWLAICADMDPPPELSTDWGVIRIDEKGGYKHLRKPAKPGRILTGDAETSAWKAIAQINTLQRLPSWFTALSAGAAIRELEQGDFIRPWSLWAQRPPDADKCEETGIL